MLSIRLSTSASMCCQPIPSTTDWNHNPLSKSKGRIPLRYRHILSTPKPLQIIRFLPLRTNLTTSNKVLSWAAATAVSNWTASVTGRVNFIIRTGVVTRANGSKIKWMDMAFCIINQIRLLMKDIGKKTNFRAEANSIIKTRTDPNKSSITPILMKSTTTGSTMKVINGWFRVVWGGFKDGRGSTKNG